MDVMDDIYLGWHNKILRIKKWADDSPRLDSCSANLVSRTYSKAYLRHLIISGEILGAQIASIHNLAFYLDLVSCARKKIEDAIIQNGKTKL